MLRHVGLLVTAGLLLTTIVIAGTPVQLSYVYADSMEPTLSVNDGYILVPASPIQQGDIVTFRRPTDDDYVTHRIVTQTTEGYITKGDNNPLTDQATGHPPVTRDQIVGEVLTLGDTPILIPALGTVVGPLHTNNWVLVGGTVLGVCVVLLGRTVRKSRRQLTRVQSVIAPLFGVCLLAVTTVVVAGGLSKEVTLIATQATPAGETAGVIPVGTSKQVAFSFNQPTGLLTHRLLETNGMTVTHQKQSPTTINVTGVVPPPTSPGVVSVSVSVTQYPAILPRPIVAALHRVHPLAAAAGSSSALFLPLWAVTTVIVDPKTPLRTHPGRGSWNLWRRLR